MKFILSGKRFHVSISFRPSPTTQGGAGALPAAQLRSRKDNKDSAAELQQIHYAAFTQAHKCITSHFPPSPAESKEMVMHSGCGKSRCVDDPSIRIGRDHALCLTRLPVSLFHYAMIVAQHDSNCKNNLPESKKN